jgi:hypothetical protein
MSRRKPLAAFAAIMAALAVAVPAASASAATTAPAVGTTLIGFPVFGLTNPTCPILVRLLQHAALSGNQALANVFSIQLLYFCPNPAI